MACVASIDDTGRLIILSNMSSGAGLAAGPALAAVLQVSFGYTAVISAGVIFTGLRPAIDWEAGGDSFQPGTKSPYIAILIYRAPKITLLSVDTVRVQTARLSKWASGIR